MKQKPLPIPPLLRADLSAEQKMQWQYRGTSVIQRQDGLAILFLDKSYK